ncbi:uncharacterized protein LOC144442256 isoform X1 [Glandiceps talaboti]
MSEQASKRARMDKLEIAKSFLAEWNPPEFAKKMKDVPKHRVELANMGTPIHRWNIETVPDDFELYVKRDDMTGSTLTGNKIRNIEFLLGDAVSKGYKGVVTCGAFTSNHCRTTAVASAQLGLDAHILIRGGGEKVPLQGNLKLSRFSGANLYRLPDTTTDPGFYDKMVELSNKVKSVEGGKGLYIIPIGGSSYPGLFGYINCFGEMMSQGLLDRFTDVVVTCGTAVTTGALAIANYLTGSKLRIHSFSIKRPIEFIYGYVQESIDLAGLSCKAEDIVSPCVDYIGKGYGKNTEEELDFIRNTANSTGIVLDPVYTGKAARGVVEEMKNNPSRFKGKKVLFVHTGGVFSIYTDERFDEGMTKEGSAANKVHYWMEGEPPINGPQATEQ